MQKTKKEHLFENLSKDNLSKISKIRFDGKDSFENYLVSNNLTRAYTIDELARYLFNKGSEEIEKEKQETFKSEVRLRIYYGDWSYMYMQLFGKIAKQILYQEKYLSSVKHQVGISTVENHKRLLDILFYSIYDRKVKKIISCL